MSIKRLSDEAIDNTISYASAIEDAAEVGAEVGMGFDFSSAALLSMAQEIKERRSADPPPPGHYRSTACHHGHHDCCRLVCKFCGKSCSCSCHVGKVT